MANSSNKNNQKNLKLLRWKSQIYNKKSVFSWHYKATNLEEQKLNILQHYKAANL